MQMMENDVSPTFNKDMQDELIMSPLRNMAFNTGVVSKNRKADRIEVFVGSREGDSPDEDGVESTNLKPEIQKTMLRDPDLN